ncbi:hypothetical protein A3H26_01960 [candidate division WWE3 bacterium RIFCSPLOWO2_12_FULL_36_10]|uniref:Penicillin-binding protein transpeptidase domain-containing protein n=1 Tax=candidate division WWE3 bacterium RIFCSPLOWO2_12_FULL_36_10 TaxID=1802630 RepID=A0A1F4VGC1_UNCKA|nr:MAG: hypothetical protein A3H26_01960 [candidate division WWE3 bacterium RIFCSPLOWO2_12_FULL_36_10]
MHLFVLFLFALRLLSIQVFQNDKYKTLAKQQHTDLQDIPAKRGDILSSDGFPLATTRMAYLMYAEPKKLLNTDETIEKLIQILKSSDSTIDTDKLEDDLHKLLTLDLYWVLVRHNVSLQVKEKIESAGLKGIGFEEEPVRYYPEGSLASHVLGFVGGGEDSGLKGYFGIEGFFDGDLRGKSGRVIEEKGALGNPILVGGYKKVDTINGRDFVLTLNRAVQYIVEKRLKEGVIKYGAVSGSVIVMNPETGEIIAMANYPTYDPKDFTKEVNIEDKETFAKIERKNLAIADTYEPGSVIKSLTISSAVDLNIVNPQTTFSDDGPVSYSGHVINNWDGKHYGIQTIIQLLQKSNNIGAAWVGHLVGSERIHKYFSNFGLGFSTGIELEGEDAGILRDSAEWTDIDLANAAFGQGLLTTSIQILNAFNAVVNGGNLMKPKIVSKIIDNGKEIIVKPKVVRRIISEKTSETMIFLLTKAVEGGESKYFNIKNYQIAGKTGTAQIFVDGKYDSQKTNATFIGYVPVSKKFSMIVRLDQPTSSVFAAETAVPLWMDIAKDLLVFYSVTPDKF